MVRCENISLNVIMYIYIFIRTLKKEYTLNGFLKQAKTVESNKNI